MENLNKSNVEKVMENAMRKLNEISGNQVLGAPVKNELGQMVVPVSNVTVADFGGGGEYGDVKIVKETDALPFAGGSGAVVSMKPMGFLIDDGKSCHLLRITDEPIDNLIERAGEIVQNIMAKD